jgi:hypothetical protein
MPKRLSIKKIERSGTLTSGSPIVNILTTSMVVGDPIYGTGIPAGTRIRSIDVMGGTITLGNATLTADVNATESGSRILSVMTDDIVVKKAEKLANAVTINGVAFDGSENITVTTQPLTAEEVLDLILTVDGADSELDADLLDGEEGSYYASKEYVDNVAQGLKAAPAVEVATTGPLTATYNNGVSGVGATLTATTNGAFPEIDGYTLTSTTFGSNGVLVKNQTNAAHNGRYNLTQQGTASLPWILTKCQVCDEADEIPGSYVFVKHGDTLVNTGWIANVTDAATYVVGTDAVNYFQFSGAGTYTVEDGLLLDGNVLSLDTNVVVTRDENGNIEATSAGFDFIDMTINEVEITEVTGRLFYNDSDDTLNIVHQSGVLQRIGNDFYIPLTINDSGVQINAGEFVMVTGVPGNSDRMSIAKAVTDGTVNPMFMVGVAAVNIPNNSEIGKITTNGLIRNVNTNAWTKGTVLYPNPAVAGGFTSAVPTAPAIKTPIAIVIRQGINNGILYVRMTNGSRLGETDSNVEFVSIADKQLIAYNGTNSRWENTTNLSWDFANARLGIGNTAPTEKLDVTGNIKSSGSITGSTLVSSVATGTAPLTVTSTTAVTNLNADLLDGQHGSYYAADSTVVKLTGDQTIAGTKTFSSTITGSISGNAGSSTLIATTQKSDNVNYQVPFLTSVTAGNQALYTDSASSITFNPSTDVLSVPNLTVTGNILVNNVEMISTSNGIVFEGTTNDANETTLSAINPTADRSILLPDASGTVALTGHLMSSHSATAWRMFFSNATTTAIQELAFGTVGTYLRSGGATANPTWATIAYSEISGTPSIPTSFNITANATDGLLDLTGTGGANSVTYSLAPYAAQQASTLSFDTSTTNPTLTTRLNLNGHLYATRLSSTVANGTAPLTVLSTTLVSNLNADLLDGQEGSYYLNYANFTGTPTIGNGALALEASSTAGSTNTTVTVETGTGFSANATGASTYKYRVGPALTALSTIMTGATPVGFLKKTGQDTYSIDTNTYLTAHPTISLTTDTTSTANPGYSGTFTAIDSVTRDSNGHVTTLNTKTVTMPAAQSIPTGFTISAGATDGLFDITGTGGTNSVSYAVAPYGSKQTTLQHFYTGTTNPTVTTRLNLDAALYATQLYDNGLRVLTAHPAVSAATSSNNSGRTYIQDVLVDSFGHVTGLATATETVVDTNTTYSISTEGGATIYEEIIRLAAGGSGSGNDDVILAVGPTGTSNTYGLTIAESGETITFAHADTSTQASVNNSGRTYIQDVTLDEFGHVTGLVSASESVVDTNTTYSVKASAQTGGAGLDLDAGGSGSGTDTVKILGSGATTVTRTDADTITISSTDTTYSEISESEIDSTTDSNGRLITGRRANYLLRNNVTATTTANLATGVTANTATKTVNLGTGGASGSTTNINIGSSVAGTTTINSPSTITSGSLTVGGNLLVNGNLTTINSTTMTVDDPIITLGGDTAPSVDDSKDRGIEFRYFDTAARLGFFGYDRSIDSFTGFKQATNTSEVFSGTLLDARFNSFVGSLGAVGTPSFTFTGDTNTGMYSPAADTLAFVEGGVEVIRINSSGNVGIGTTSPSDRLVLSTNVSSVINEIRFGGVNGRTLSAYSGGSLANFDFQAVQTYFNSDFLIPDTKIIRTANGNNGNLRLSTNNLAAYVQVESNLRVDGNTGLGTSAPVERLDVIGGLNLRSAAGNNGTAYGIELRTSSNLPRIDFVNNGVYVGQFSSDSTNMIFKNNLQTTGDIQFETRATGESVTSSKLIILNSGNVGIGTVTPGAQLEVKSNATDKIPLVVDTLSGHTARLQDWKLNGSILAYVTSAGRVQAEGFANNAATNNALVWTRTTGTEIQRNIADTNTALIVNQVHASSTGDIFKAQAAGTDRLSIKRDGKVGIGTAAPVSLLNVNATGRAATIGGVPVGVPNGTITSGLTSYLELVAGTGAATNGSGIVFHNPGVSTASLEYKNADANLGYFNFRSDDTTYRVGIGTVTPTEALEVNGNIKSTRYLNATSLGTNPGNSRNHFSGINAGNANLTTGWISAAFGDASANRVVIGQGGNVGSGAILGAHDGNLTAWADLSIIGTATRFFTVNSSVYNERMRIANDGNVGIGTASPAQKLEVVGNTKTQDLIISDTSNVAKATMKYDSTSKSVKFVFA